MFPNLEFVKTALNAITAKFQRVKSDVDAVKSDVDAVKANVDLVDQKSTKYLHVKLESKGQGGYILDVAPKYIIKHIQSGGNVYIQHNDTAKESLQLDVIIISEEPVCLIFYCLTKDHGLSYFVWDTEDMQSFNTFKYSRYLTARGTGSLRCSGTEITVGSGYMSDSITITNWQRGSVIISHNNSKSADTYILIDLRNTNEIAGVRFALALTGGTFEVPFVDYEASDYPSVIVRYILLHITVLNSKSCHAKEVFYGETLDALEYKPINIMLYCTDNYGYSHLRSFSISNKYKPTSYSVKNNVDVTTFIL